MKCYPEECMTDQRISIEKSKIIGVKIFIFHIKSLRPHIRKNEEKALFLELIKMILFFQNKI